MSRANACLTAYEQFNGPDFSNMLRSVQINATLSAIIILPLAAFVRFVLVLFVLFYSLR